MCNACETEDEVHAKRKGDASGGREGPAADASPLASLAGRGRPLPSSIRAEFEPRFGHDFSDVHLHTDSSSADAFDASAYTYGRHVVFGPGRFDPSSPRGRHLIAHELAHVVQSDRDPGVANRIARQTVPGASNSVLPAREASQDFTADVIVEEIVDDAPGALTGLARSSQILAGGSLGWLPSTVDRVDRVLLSHNWASLLSSWDRSGSTILDRTLDVIPRDLLTSFESGGAIGTHPRMRMGENGRVIEELIDTWLDGPGAFTREQLTDVRRVVQRYNTVGWESLEASEQQLLQRVVTTHSGGSRNLSPVMSFSTEGNAPNLNNKRWRVRMRLSALDALSTRRPYFTINNAAECEVLMTTTQQGEILAVERAGERTGWILRNARTLRTVARGLAGAGLVLGAYNVYRAPPEQRTTALLHETGSFAGGAWGASLGAAACVAFGVGTGGVGFVLCGIGGALAGGFVGGRIGHGMGEMMHVGGVVCPSCHANQRAASQRIASPLSTVGVSRPLDPAAIRFALEEEERRAAEVDELEAMMEYLRRQRGASQRP